jgi:hypothetical protein
VTAARRELAGRMAEAAHAFLDVLDGDQRAVAAWPFPSDDERRRWFYTPTDHGGLALRAMSPAQERAALRLVASGLSRPGFVTVSTIMGLDNVLDELEGWWTTWGRERGRDPGLYYLRIFGTPGGDDWSWRFGGHHVSVNHTILGGEVVASTPCFLGADPASSPLLGPHPLRPLEGVEDLARELVRSLDAEQRRQAVVAEVAPVDLVSANRTRLNDGDVPLPLAEVWRGRFTGDLGARVEAVQRDAERAAGLRAEHIGAVRYTTTPKGIRAAALRPDQRDVLRALLDLYVRRVPDDLAADEAGKYAGERLLDHSFLWAGGTEPAEGHYYRVQGPRVVVEYDNTQRGANHIHSVWRDPTGDFADPLTQHYRTSHGRARPGT